MLDIIKVIILGIVEGITEWLPVSSTGHLILVGNVLKPSMSDAFMEMFDVVIQLGAIMAVVVLYFHKLNPFSPRKSHKQKMLTWQMWIKVLIALVPAGIVGVLFNDILDEIFYKPIPVAVMLIVYGILFIVVENHNAGKKPSVTRISQLSVQMLLWIGFFQNACADTGNIKIRSYDCRSTADRSIKRSGCRIYIFPGNSGNVWCQSFETDQIRFPFYRRRIWSSDAWMYRVFWIIGYCDQVPYGIYQTA